MKLRHRVENRNDPVCSRKLFTTGHDPIQNKELGIRWQISLEVSGFDEVCHEEVTAPFDSQCPGDAIGSQAISIRLDDSAANRWRDLVCEEPVIRRKRAKVDREKTGQRALTESICDGSVHHDPL
jgi:hypothetical protein